MTDLDARPAPVVERCGCERPPRRVCDLCRGPRYAFVACSNGCLRAHQGQAHLEGHAPAAGQRVRDALRRSNRRDPGNWERYTNHRRKVQEGVCIDGYGGAIAILGAGSCADVDLEFLCSHFDEVHLADLDGEIIERTRDRLPSAARSKTVLHGGIDFSGLLDRIDDFGESFPSPQELGPLGVIAAQSIAARLGGPFKRTLSTCVLSQLLVPFQENLVTSSANWEYLGATLIAVHLITLARATRPGGSSFMAFDVLSSDAVPAMRAMHAEPPPEGFEALVVAEAQAAGVGLSPDPAALLLLLTSPQLASAVATPELSPPWLWQISPDTVQLVYGLSFTRR